MKETNETILEMKELARLNQVDVLYEKAKWLVKLIQQELECKCTKSVMYFRPQGVVCAGCGGLINFNKLKKDKDGY